MQSWPQSSSLCSCRCSGLCFNTRNISKHPHGRWAVLGCSAAQDPAWLLPCSCHMVLLGCAGSQWLSSSRSIPPDVGRGQISSGSLSDWQAQEGLPKVRRGWVHLPTTWHLFSNLCSPFVSPGQRLFLWARLLYMCQALLLFFKAAPKMRFASKKWQKAGRQSYSLHLSWGFDFFLSDP